MKHYIIFKYGRDSWTVIYEYHGTLDMAQKYQKTLSQSMNCILILCEVV